jgi:hypothetical protein
MKKNWYFILLIFVLSCSKSADFTISYPKNSAYDLPIKIGYDAKMFTPKEIGMFKAKTGQDALDNVLNEKTGMAIIPLSTLWENNEVRENLKFFGYFQREGIAIANRDSISSPIGIIENSFEQYLINYLLEVDSLDYEIKTYKNYKALSKAYKNHEINGVCLKAPLLFKIDFFADIIWLKKYFGRYPNSALIARKDVYMQNKQKFDTIFKNIEKASMLYDQNVKLALDSAFLFAGVNKFYINDFINELRYLIANEEAGKKFEDKIFFNRKKMQ